jgi:hypothetical protein
LKYGKHLKSLSETAEIEFYKLSEREETEEQSDSEEKIPEFFEEDVEGKVLDPSPERI